MLKLTDLKPGIIFKFENNPYIVITSEHSKSGRGGAIMRTKIKNLKTKAIVSRTYKGSDSFEEIELERKKSQFLYREKNKLHFMDLENFDQFEIEKNQLGSDIDYLKEAENINIIFYQGTPISIDMPIKVNLKVEYTEPGFKGNTQSTTFKPARLETGAEIEVPLFININDIIVVDTRSGNYVERVNNS